MASKVDIWMATVLGGIGMWIAYLVGLGVASWRHARKGYNTAKAVVPLLRKVKWALFRAALGIGALLLLWMFVMGGNASLPRPWPSKSAVPAEPARVPR
jgi:hypothetical protein